MIPEIMRSRVMFGFLRKRSKGHVKYFITRWWFLISSRPLNMEDFLEDEHVLAETELPPLYEFDTMYYYYMDTPYDASGAQGQIPTNKIISVQIKNMQESKEEGHAFVLDTGSAKYHLNAIYRFEMERWIEAIIISMQTARESKLSLTGSCKNISKIVTSFDSDQRKLQQVTQDKLDKNLPLEVEDWENDLETLIQECTKVKDDLVTTFDACLALKPHRIDIVRFYMELSHAHLMKLLGDYWETYAIDLNPFETLTVIDWAYNYNK